MSTALAAVIQITSTGNKVANLATCKRLIGEDHKLFTIYLSYTFDVSHSLERAKQRGAIMAFLPEGFDFIADSKEETFRMAETLEGNTISTYRAIARSENFVQNVSKCIYKMYDS